MSGVIDEHGQQWEHCNVCEKFIQIETLGYLETLMDGHGVDICMECADKQVRAGEIQFDRVQPGAGWVAVYYCWPHNHWKPR